MPRLGWNGEQAPKEKEEGAPAGTLVAYSGGAAPSPSTRAEPSPPVRVDREQPAPISRTLTEDVKVPPLSRVPSDAGKGRFDASARLKAQGHNPHKPSRVLQPGRRGDQEWLYERARAPVAASLPAVPLLATSLPVAPRPVQEYVEAAPPQPPTEYVSPPVGLVRHMEVRKPRAVQMSDEELVGDSKFLSIEVQSTTPSHNAPSYAPSYAPLYDPVYSASHAPSSAPARVAPQQVDPMNPEPHAPSSAAPARIAPPPVGVLSPALGAPPSAAPQRDDSISPEPVRRSEASSPEQWWYDDGLCDDTESEEPRPADDDSFYGDIEEASTEQGQGRSPRAPTAYMLATLRAEQVREQVRGNHHRAVHVVDSYSDVAISRAMKEYLTNLSIVDIEHDGILPRHVGDGRTSASSSTAGQARSATTWLM